MEVPVYTQESRADTFIYTTEQLALDGFTICFWMKGIEEDDDWMHDMIISIATPGRPTERKQKKCLKMITKMDKNGRASCRERV